METSPKVSSQELLASLQGEINQFVEGVAETVNNAADGEWIAGSEERVRDLAAGLRQKVFERAVQMKVDAAEAAFPPSARADERKAPGQ